MPYASHDDFTQHVAKSDYYVSDYDKKWDVLTRDGAIKRANSIRKKCAKTVFYTDLGLSGGMKAAISYCEDNNIEIEMRTIDSTKIVEYIKSELVTEDFIKAIITGADYSEYLN